MKPKKRPRLYLSPPHMCGLEEENVREAFASKWIAPLGPQVTAFEKEVAAYTGVRGALALSSGTAALHLALRLQGVGPGDYVFCSSLTFIGSVNPILYLGAKPVFIDSECETWNMSPIALKKAFINAEETGKLPRAVVIVDLYGQSADYLPLLKICNEYGVPVIEDAAEALGASYHGRSCGSWGKLGAFSFNGNKIITTSCGGMLISDDQDALNKALFWATQARDQASWYQHSEMGYNYRMSNLLAAVGRAQLTVLDERVEKRRSIYEEYFEALSGLEGIDFIPRALSGRCNNWLTVMTIDPQYFNITPMYIVQSLEQRNIESRPVWKPMHLQPLFAGSPYYTHDDSNSISDRLFSCGICLPSGSNMSDSDLEYVIESLISILENGKI